MDELDGLDEDLSPEALSRALPGRPLRTYPALASTAAAAHAWARSGAHEGAVIVAGYQAAPRVGEGGEPLVAVQLRHRLQLDLDDGPRREPRALGRLTKDPQRLDDGGGRVLGCNAEAGAVAATVAGAVHDAGVLVEHVQELGKPGRRTWPPAGRLARLRR